MSNKQQHRHLISAEVVFALTPEGEAEPEWQTARINGVLVTKFRNILAKDIGKAQQIAQMQLIKKLDNAAITVADVFLFPFSYLGFQTEKEWQDQTQLTKPTAPVTALPASPFAD